MDIEEIAKRFSEERERIGYTKVAFARLIGVTTEAFRLIESGKSDFRVSTLASAAEAGVDAQYVLTGVKSRNTESVERVIGYDKNVFNAPIQGVGIAQGGANVQVIHSPKYVQTTKAVTKPGIEHIAEPQKAELQRLVEEIVKQEAEIRKDPKSFRAVWSSLNRHCGVSSYSLIRLDDFEKARKYLNMWIGRLNSAKSAPVKLGDDWRKRQYSYIKTNTKDPEDAAALKAHLARKYKVESLTELDNNQLKDVYQYVAGRKARKR